MNVYFYYLEIHPVGETMNILCRASGTFKTNKTEEAAYLAFMEEIRKEMNVSANHTVMICSFNKI